MLKWKNKPLHGNEIAAGGSAPVSVEYCVPGNYDGVARGLAEAIERQFGLSVELVPSCSGVFEIAVDGRLVFSKRATWRFPDHDEIFYHLERRD